MLSTMRLQITKNEISDLLHLLDFAPSGHNVHRKPIYQLGHMTQHTTRPPYHPPEDWQAMEIVRRRKATVGRQEEKQVLAAKRSRAANLQAALDGYSARGGYIKLDPAAPGVSPSIPMSTAQSCASSASRGGAGGMRGIVYRVNRSGACALLHASFIDIAMLAVDAQEKHCERTQVDDPKPSYACTARGVGKSERMRRPSKGMGPATRMRERRLLGRTSSPREVRCPGFVTALPGRH